MNRLERKLQRSGHVAMRKENYIGKSVSKMQARLSRRWPKRKWKNYVARGHEIETVDAADRISWKLEIQNTNLYIS